MKSSLRSLVGALAVSLAALATSAHAQLEIAGSSHGTFTGSDSFFTLINNGPVTSTLYTGIAVPFFSPTTLSFTGQNFASVGDGDSFGLGTVKIKNGRTLFNTAASFASMDLYLNLPAHGIANFKLTTLEFAIENTPNLGSVPDLYYIGFSAPASLKVDDTLIKFAISFTDDDYITTGEVIGEKKTGSVGLNASVNFTPVPEPSTYAAIAGLGLVTLIATRRLRRPRMAT